jgi:hypothetical protein
MPVHDWSRVTAGVFHALHVVWIGQLQIALNSGILPNNFYALAEQDAGNIEPDVLALQRTKGGDSQESPNRGGTLLVADAPPPVWQTESHDSAAYLAKHRTLAIHSTDDDRVVALVEIVSPGNKAGSSAFERFVEKALNCFAHHVNLLVVDLNRPTKRDPQGLHGAIMSAFDDSDYVAPQEKKLTLVSYEAGIPLNAYIQPIAPGDVLGEMPLFLERGQYVNVPLEQTYMTAFESMPLHYRTQLSAKKPQQR